MLEHLNRSQLSELLETLKKVAGIIMCIIPMGDNGKYRIPEYHNDISHLIAENEEWWIEAFRAHGWSVVKDCAHVPGLKDNWQDHAEGKGNRVFVFKC
jgi:hypothetical protein